MVRYEGDQELPLSLPVLGVNQAQTCSDLLLSGRSAAELYPSLTSLSLPPLIFSPHAPSHLPFRAYSTPPARVDLAALLFNGNKVLHDLLPLNL